MFSCPVGRAGEGGFKVGAEVDVKLGWLDSLTKSSSHLAGVQPVPCLSCGVTQARSPPAVTGKDGLYAERKSPSTFLDFALGLLATLSLSFSVARTMSNLPTNDLAFRKWLSSRLDPFQELDSDHELYVPLHEGSENDPLELVANDIRYAEDHTLNFISGFNGCGKSTELLRLQKTLSAQGFFVVIADASDYFLPTQPIDIGILLISLAGAYSDQIEKQTELKPDHQSYWRRLVQWLQTTNVNLDGFDLNAQVPLTDIEVKFKASLKENPGFIEKLQRFMAARPGELKRQVHDYFQHATQLVRTKYRADLSPVFIFDQFEQLHDIPQTEGKVAESIITIVSNHQSDLRIHGHHVIMTMPPWLKLLPGGAQNLHLIYGLKLWENDDKRSSCREGLQQMRIIVEKRFTQAGLDRFFGPANRRGVRRFVDQLIRASGGHLRDLIILLRGALKRAKELPVTSNIIDATIANHRDSFLPLSLSHSRYLDQFGRERQCSFPNTRHETIYDVTTLLNNHYAFLMRNDAEWCDIHPLLRDIVAQNIARSAGATAVPPSSEAD